MSNRLKSEIEAERKLAEPKKKEQQEKPVEAPSAFSVWLSKKAFSKEAATDALPFLLFLSFLGMIYIGNRHNAENNIRKIDGLTKEVKELSWDFKTLKADLMFQSRQTEVIKKVDSLLGLKVSVKPPIKLKAN
ncbi:MAG TPA: FtsL-like putative cell division protein [Pelobium sp.]|nr:FtsL-like putative cell division protein [Pelobium sp.]